MIDNSFHIITFGCQMNVHDSERIAGVLEAAGYVRASREQEEAHDLDLIVMNTCAVRENAAERMYGTIGLWAKMKRERPHMQIAIGGCMAQLDRERIAKRTPWVDAVFGTRNIEDLPALLERTKATGRPQTKVNERLEVFPSDLPAHRASKTSAWVAISVGCNNTCTFCIVPTTRGRERDRRPGDVLAEIRAVVAGGLRELGYDLFDSPGGLYVWMRAPEGLDGDRFADELLDGAGVAVLPGSCFGRVGADHVRLSLLQPRERLADAVARIGRCC